VRHGVNILLKISFNAMDTSIFIESHKIQSVPVCWKAVVSVFYDAGVFSSVFMLWDPTVNVNMFYDTVCWLHYSFSRQRHEHLSWGMILEHNNAAPYIVQQTQGVAAVTLLVTYRKSNIGCWPCPLDYYFWASERTLERSQILQQEECRSLISAMTIVKILPRWDKCVRVLLDYVEK